MNLKQKMKNFFTLTRKANGGFTLVELIVVIAILAILGGVAVPAYSGYVTKANKQADISLASEIEQALWLAHYSNALKPGTAVVVRYGDESADYDVSVSYTGDDTTEEKVAEAEQMAVDALAATFGTSYADLRLKYDGWDEELGVLGDSVMMQYVNDSCFNEDNLEDLLVNVQYLVDELTGYFNEKVDYEPSGEMQAYFDSLGVDSTNNREMANAMTLFAGNYLTDTFDYNSEYETVDDDDYFLNWAYGRFKTENPFASEAAEYAATLALAKYIDDANLKNGKTSNYTERLMEAQGSAILGTTETIAQELRSNENELFMQYVNFDATNWQYTDSQAYKDSMAFLAYMNGVSQSADSLAVNTDLGKEDYFADGQILSYVNNYISIGEVLEGVEGSVMAFIYNGTTVQCAPLDW